MPWFSKIFITNHLEAFKYTMPGPLPDKPEHRRVDHVFLKSPKPLSKASRAEKYCTLGKVCILETPRLESLNFYFLVLTENQLLNCPLETPVVTSGKWGYQHLSHDEEGT